MYVRGLKPHFAPPFEVVRDRPGAVTVPLFGYRQTRSYSCGFATALMVLRTFGRSVEARELFERLRTGRSGTRQTAIVTELRRRGLRANIRYDLDFAALSRAIDAGKLIVAYLGDAEHWLVVYGYGRGPERVFVGDPRPGERCEHRWDAYGARLGGFGIVCSRPSVVEPGSGPSPQAR